MFLALGLQLVVAGALGGVGALLRGGLFLTLFTLPAAVLVAGMLMVMGRFGLSPLRSRLLVLPTGPLAGLIVALVAARRLLVLGLAFGLVTGACCLVLHLLLFSTPRRLR